MSAPNSAAAVAPPYLKKATEYRWRGGNRAALIQYLVRSGVDAASANHLADRIDYQIGVTHGSRPADLSAKVAAELAAQHRHGVASPTYPVANPSAQPPDAQFGAGATAAPIPSDSVEVPTAATPTRPAQPQGPMSLDDYLCSSAIPDSAAALTTPASAPPVQPRNLPHPLAPPAPTSPVQPVQSHSQPHPPAPPAFAPPAPPVQPHSQPRPQARPAPSPGPTPIHADRSATTGVPAAPTAPPRPNSSSNRSAISGPKTALHAPRSAAVATDPQSWSTTNGFGYQVAETEEFDPSAAIHGARQLARRGQTQDQIVDYLVSQGVTRGEAKYVADQTGARKTAPTGKGRPTKSAFRHTKLVTVALTLVGVLLAWLGYSEWSAGGDVASRALGISAVGAALVIAAARIHLRHRQPGQTATAIWAGRRQTHLRRRPQTRFRSRQDRCRTPGA